MMTLTSLAVDHSHLANQAVMAIIMKSTVFGRLDIKASEKAAFQQIFGLKNALLATL